MIRSRSAFARVLAALLVFAAAIAHAHDPSSWGGTYRTRDFGRSWLSADAGLFIGASLDIAISPIDPNHLLYATDTRLLRSRNGGREWLQEAPAVFFGPTLAVTFLDDGIGALASTAAGLYRTQNGVDWQPVSLPQSAVPVRRLIQDAQSKRVVALGARGVLVSEDRGKTFARVGADVLPDQTASALLVHGATLWVASGGDAWASADWRNDWAVRSSGLPKGRIEAMFADSAAARTLWVAGADQVFRSDDEGATWRAVGRPLAEAGTAIRGLAVDASGKAILLGTHRGLLRSLDGGDSWNLAEGGTLPVHLESGPLRGDPRAPGTWYVGFSLMPYAELWRRAEEGTNLLSQVDPVSLAGLAAFLVLLVLGGTLLARHLIARGTARNASGSKPS